MSFDARNAGPAPALFERIDDRMAVACGRVLLLDLRLISLLLRRRRCGIEA